MKSSIQKEPRVTCTKSNKLLNFGAFLIFFFALAVMINIAMQPFCLSATNVLIKM